MDQGRPMEIDALVKAVQELGVLTKTGIPYYRHGFGFDAAKGKNCGFVSPISNYFLGTVR